MAGGGREWEEAVLLAVKSPGRKFPMVAAGRTTCVRRRCGRHH